MANLISREMLNPAIYDDSGVFVSDNECKERYIEWCKSRDMAEASIRGWVNDMRAFESWNAEHNGSKPIVAITDEDIDLYREYLSSSTSKTESAIKRCVRAPSMLMYFYSGGGDLRGKHFGDLTVLDIDASNPTGGNLHMKWLCRCEKCGQIKSIRGSDLRLGRTHCGCESFDIMGAKFAKSDFMIGRKFGHLTVLRRDDAAKRGDGRHARWICSCDICGREESVVGSVLRSDGKNYKDRCSMCVRKSNGEAAIREILAQNNVAFTMEKTFPDLRNPDTNYHLRFDFYILPTTDTPAYLIEYDGGQHYKVAPMWDDSCSFEKRKYLDAIKTEWCQTHNIGLIRVPYTQRKHLSYQDLDIQTSQFVVVAPQSASLADL